MAISSPAAFQFSTTLKDTISLLISGFSDFMIPAWGFATSMLEEAPLAQSLLAPHVPDQETLRVSAAASRPRGKVPACGRGRCHDEPYVNSEEEC